MPHAHHRMRRIVPSDTESLKDFDGKTVAMEILCIKKGEVKFLPNGNPEAEFIKLKVKGGDFLPCEVSKVFATDTTVKEMYGIYKFNPAG